MPDDTAQRASLAYRRARDEIRAGRVPEKYTRLGPFIPFGGHVLEIGAAEGVLSLWLAREQAVDRVTALELRPDRHAEGLGLMVRWADLGFDVSRCRLEVGDIRKRLDLLDGVDTLVAVRAIYYLEDDAERVLRAAWARRIDRIVLCGNRNRQAKYRANPIGESFNRPASVEGMRALLQGAGYEIDTVVDEGDPIVCGRHPDRA